MKRILIATALSLAVIGTAHAQIIYDSTGQRLNFYTGGDTGSLYQPSYPVPSLPAVPQIESYIPQPGLGPTGYPCTMPYCR